MLLEGPTGIGKSEIVAEFARRRGISHLIIDLSLLEPPDLVGMPVIRDGRTHYAFPSELPTEGAGILMLEELNRAELPVMQPALQLLSARRLHAYELPADWSCVAAINPESDEYQVSRLDPALRARFMELLVHADVSEWLKWAHSAGVHPAVIRVVTSHPTVFETASPRSFAYASQVLCELTSLELADEGFMFDLMRGFLPSAWAGALVAAFKNNSPATNIDLSDLTSPATIASFLAAVKEAASRRQSDVVYALAFKLRMRVDAKNTDSDLGRSTITIDALEHAVSGLPGDLAANILERFADSPAGLATSLDTTVGDFEFGRTPYKDSPLERRVKEWMNAKKGHRARICVRHLTTGFERTVRDLGVVDDTRKILLRDVRLLAQDVGAHRVREILKCLKNFSIDAGAAG